MAGVLFIRWRRRRGLGCQGNGYCASGTACSIARAAQPRGAALSACLVRHRGSTCAALSCAAFRRGLVERHAGPASIAGRVRESMRSLGRAAAACRVSTWAAACRLPPTRGGAAACRLARVQPRTEPSERVPAPSAPCRPRRHRHRCRAAQSAPRPPAMASGRVYSTRSAQQSCPQPRRRPGGSPPRETRCRQTVFRQAAAGLSFHGPAPRRPAASTP